MFILSLLKTRVDGVLEDERQLQMVGKAAQISFQILLPILMLMSLALLTGRTRRSVILCNGCGNDFVLHQCFGFIDLSNCLLLF